MDRLDAMRAFHRVVETGSFSAVARERGVAQPTISKQIAALESHLGAQLLNRTSRSLSLTESGQEFYEATSKVLADLDAAESRIGRRQAAPSGMLRVTLSAGIGRMHVIPALPEFLGRYPELSIDIVISDRFLDLVGEGIDLAVRIGQLDDSSLIARRIGSSGRRTFASQTYLRRHGAPQEPTDLARHDCIAFVFQGAAQDWRFEGPDGPVMVRPSGRIRSNDAETIRQAVLSGLGIAHAPSWLFHREIASGEVKTLIEEWRPAPDPINAVHPAARLPSTKIRVFTEFLTDILMRQPHFAS
jgi:LysR family transcriptional regulator, regulator for bpeEF and oprC